MNTIKNIIFDFGGVIVDINKQNAIKRFKELGVETIEDYLGEFRQTGVFLALEEGKIEVDEFNAAICKIAGKEISAQDIASGWLAFLDKKVDANKIALLKDLHRRFKLYLLSNTNPVIMGWANSDEFLPSHEPLSSFFDKCYCSYQIGCAKPDRAIYEHMIEDSGILASETLFVDDGENNINMGRFFGFKTHLYKKGEDLRTVFAKL
jgi:putative hydrolase of the HAD superfamily